MAKNLPLVRPAVTAVIGIWLVAAGSLVSAVGTDHAAGPVVAAPAPQAPNNLGWQ